MAQYIDKDALVAEIKKQIEFGKLKCRQSQENNDHESYVAWSEHIGTCGKFLSFINTLEVKEVDLEKEIDKIDDAIPGKREDIEYIAKHFFELGIKAQKGE